MSLRADFHTSRTPLVLVVLFVLLLPAVTTRLNASDEIQFFAWLRSWTFDRDVDFENEYRHFHDLAPEKHTGFRATFLEITNEAGRRPNFGPIGTALLWSPFYAVGHAVARLTGAPADGYSQPYVAAVAYGSALYGLASLVIAVDCARRILGRRGTGAALTVWFGTPLIFYMYVAPGFAHACSAFAVALFIWTWLRVRERWTPAGAAALGAVGGLLPMVREQDLFLLAGPAVDFLRFAWHRRSTSDLVPPVLAAAVAFVIVYTPQLLAYYALNGHPSPTTLVTRKMTWTAPHFFDVVASPQHGLFFWTPLALVAIGGLVWLAMRARPAGTGAPDSRWIACVLLIMVVLQVYVSGSVESWTVAGSFGQRRFVALTPVFVIGLAALMPQAGARGLIRAVAAAAIIVCIWWNVGLMVQFGLHLMDRQRLSIAANARTTFLTLPLQAPGIVWRYFTDRESFFGLPQQRQSS